MIILFSDTNQFYYIPSEVKVPNGSTILYSFSGATIKVDADQIVSFKISKTEAARLLLKQGFKARKSVFRFLKQALRQTKGKEPKANTQNAINQSIISIIKESYQSAISNKYQPKEQMQEIRKSMESSGIKTTKEFEQIPNRLQGKYMAKDGQIGLEESVNAFRKYLKRKPLMKQR